MNRLKVSIIIPVHNSENTLGRCIESVISQNYDNLECILVENGSTDNSKKMCEEYAKKHNYIIFLSIASIGVSKARNAGLSIATGDIISFCDSDDFYEKNSIVDAVSEFEKNERIAAVFGGISTGIQKYDKIIKHYRKLKDRVVSVKKAMQLVLVNDSVMGSVCNKYYRTSHIKGIRFSEQLILCEDMHFNSLVLDSLDRWYKVKILSKPIYCYMENECSTTHNDKLLFDDENNSNYIKALEKIKADCNLDYKTESILRMKIVYFVIDLLINCNLDQNRKNKLMHLLRDNFLCLVQNLFINDFRMNIKRIIQGVYIMFLHN